MQGVPLDPATESQLLGLPAAGGAGQVAAAPGAGLYAARLRKCLDVPAEQRTADEAAFVACAAVMDEAAAVLVPLAESGRVPDENDQRTTAALLQWASVTMALEPGQPMGLPHAQLGQPSCLLRLLQPLMVVRLQERGHEVSATSPVLRDMLRATFVGKQPIRSLQRWVQLALLTRVTIGESDPQYVSGCAEALQFSVSHAEGAAALQEQLTALQAHVAAAGSTWRVPPLATLQAAAGLLTMDSNNVWLSQGMRSPAVYECMEAGARRFAAAAPTNPRAWDFVGIAIGQRYPKPLASAQQREAVLQPWQRGLEAARAAGSDVWRARLALQICENSFLVPSVSPQQAIALVEEAEEAYKRAKQRLPSDWLTTLRNKRDHVRNRVLPTIRKFLAKSSGSWDAELGRRLMPAAAHPMPSRVESCSGCGLNAMALSTCSACKEAKYCSRECQKRAWPEHKAACKEAQKAREARKAGAQRQRQ